MGHSLLSDKQADRKPVSVFFFFQFFLVNRAYSFKFVSKYELQLLTVICLDLLEKTQK